MTDKAEQPSASLNLFMVADYDEVCPDCKGGKNRKNCKTCRGRGTI